MQWYTTKEMKYTCHRDTKPLEPEFAQISSLTPVAWTTNAELVT